MSIKEIGADLCGASAMAQRMLPSIKHGSRFIGFDLCRAHPMAQYVQPWIESESRTIQAFSEWADITRAFHDFARELDRFQRRKESLRYQLKRKGRPGWKHLRR